MCHPGRDDKTQKPPAGDLKREGGGTGELNKVGGRIAQGSFAIFIRVPREGGGKTWRRAAELTENDEREAVEGKQ